jgi:hypothetical protein
VKLVFCILTAQKVHWFVKHPNNTFCMYPWLEIKRILSPLIYLKMRGSLTKNQELKFNIKKQTQLCNIGLSHFYQYNESIVQRLQQNSRVFFTEVRGTASNSAYYGYPELWILRYPAHRYHAVPWPGFEPMTLWLRVRHPNHSATTLSRFRTHCLTIKQGIVWSS